MQVMISRVIKNTPHASFELVNHKKQCLQISWEGWVAFLCQTEHDPTKTQPE